MQLFVGILEANYIATWYYGLSEQSGDYYPRLLFTHTFRNNLKTTYPLILTRTFWLPANPNLTPGPRNHNLSHPPRSNELTWRTVRLYTETLAPLSYPGVAVSSTFILRKIAADTVRLFRQVGILGRRAGVAGIISAAWEVFGTVTVLRKRPSCTVRVQRLLNEPQDWTGLPSCSFTVHLTISSSASPQFFSHFKLNNDLYKLKLLDLDNLEDLPVTRTLSILI